MYMLQESRNIPIRVIPEQLEICQKLLDTLSMPGIHIDSPSSREKVESAISRALHVCLTEVIYQFTFQDRNALSAFKASEILAVELINQHRETDMPLVTLIQRWNDNEIKIPGEDPLE